MLESHLAGGPVKESLSKEIIFQPSIEEQVRVIQRKNGENIYSGENSSGLGDRELEFGGSLMFSYRWRGLRNCFEIEKLS